MIQITENDLQKCIARAIRSDDPFPYVIIDDFFSHDVADALAAVFPTLTDFDWDLRHNSPESRQKVVCSTESKFPDVIREALLFFNSNYFVAFAEDIFNIRDLIVDQTHRGCGMHSTGKGGHVGIHSDSSRHPNRNFDQRLNAILWLNLDWQEHWGGHLELWDRSAKECRVKIAPLHNRLAMFETGTSCYHGHPHKLACPEDRRRNSLASYYYQIKREVDEDHGGWREAPHFVTFDP